MSNDCVTHQIPVQHVLLVDVEQRQQKLNKPIENCGLCEWCASLAVKSKCEVSPFTIFRYYAEKSTIFE